LRRSGAPLRRLGARPVDSGRHFDPFASAYGPLLIFSVRIVDVFLSTVRSLVVMRGQKTIAPAVALFESLLRGFAVGTAIQNLGSPWHVLGYAAGFATGNLVGLWIEEKRALGQRREVPRSLSIVDRWDPDAFVAVEEPRVVRRGPLSGRQRKQAWASELPSAARASGSDGEDSRATSTWACPEAQMNRRGEDESRASEGPVPALVHLSGPRRGTTARLLGEEVSITSSGVSAAVGRLRRHEAAFAQLVRRGLTYELRVSPGRNVWVNGERVSSFTLASGDVLEIGRGGPLLRFRLYDSGIPSSKSVGEAFSDCLDCARYGSRSTLGKAAIFLSSMPRELLTRTSLAFRAGVIGALVLLAGATVFAVHRSLELEERLADERVRVDGLRALVDQTGSGVIAPAELEGLRTELQHTLDEARSRLDSLEARTGAPRRIIARASGSTAFLQGSYRFDDPLSGRFLRIQLKADGTPRLDADGRPSVGVRGDGPFLQPKFTGTAFLVTGDGLLVTNRHVVRPWEAEAGANRLVERGFQPVLDRLVAWLPGLDRPVELEVSEVSDSSDLAVLQASDLPVGRPVLEVTGERPAAGEEVIVLGYPLGIRALLARSGQDFLARLARTGQVDFWEVARRLSSEDRIAPLASRGIVSQVTAELVVYDAETTRGGSGGPVLDMDGRVIAVNTGVMPEFGGSNLGVSGSSVRALLERLR